jgi:oxygen-independent coproporphyrinogen-3 oxidase
MAHTSFSLKDAVLKYDRAVPRYTSYPPAPIFTGDFSKETHKDWLSALPDGANLSLYAHIPFCTQLCHYCGCFTHITGRYAPVEDYAHILKREIQIKGDFMGRRHRVGHLHFGGGSPTLLREDDFRMIMTAFRESFDFTPDAEIAVEVDPRAMTPSLASTYAEMGINRISLGIQDFDMKVMTAVNRVQPFDVVYRAVQLLREVGITSFNFDFIYGLPYQTVRSLTRSMDYALLMKPDRIALYGYAHVPWKKKNMRLIPEDALPNASLRYDLFESAAAILEEDGFLPIGIDHFGRASDTMVTARSEGHLGRNFQGYTNIAPDALIGFGVSAISQFPGGYAQNTTAGHEYQDAVLGESFPIAKGYRYTGEDLARKEIIDSLMCSLSANPQKIWDKHGHAPDRLRQCLEKLAPFFADGLAALTPDGELNISPKARQVVRVIASAFDEYLPPAEEAETPIKRHAMAV